MALSRFIYYRNLIAESGEFQFTFPLLTIRKKSGLLQMEIN